MKKKNYRVLFSEKNYLKLLAADLLSRFGDSLDAIAYSWIMYEVTGSESLMAFILGLNYVPTVLLQPFTGALADQVKKKNLMVITDILRFLIVAALVSLYAAGRLTPVLIAVLTLCTSTVEAFRMPAGNAFLPMILPREKYPVGKAASYSLSRGSQLLGYVLAGGLIAAAGSAVVLWIDAASFLASAAFIANVRISEKRESRAGHYKQLGRDIRKGISFLKESRTFQTICVIGLVINFGLMPLSVFQTPYVTHYLKMGSEMLSWIKILMLTGMMAGAAAVPKLSDIRRSRLGMFAGIGMGAVLMGMFLATECENKMVMLAIVTVCMFFVGVGGGVLNVLIGICMIEVVPENMMGEMSGLNSAVMEASMPIGSFLCSVLVLKINVPRLLLLFGILTVLFYMWMGTRGRLKCLDTE